MRVRIEHEGKVLNEIEFDAVLIYALSNIPGGISATCFTSGPSGEAATGVCQALRQVVQEAADRVIKEHCGEGGGGDGG